MKGRFTIMQIYLDNSATTKPYDEVIDAVALAMGQYYGNPSSLHNIGIKCEKRLKSSREFIAKTINANKEEVYFNSGGSEGNNLILQGIVKVGNHIITTKFEHHSVLRVCQELEKIGVKVTYLDVDDNGKIDLEELEEKITKDTVLVSIMFVNNEMGVIQNIQEIGRIIKNKSSRAKFHVDSVQAYGKIPIDVKKMNIDMLTMAGHKIHGPKGTGFVYIKKGIVLKPLIWGGSQEFGVRAGTENLPGIIGLERACEIAINNIQKNFDYIQNIKAYMIERLNDIDNIRINSPMNETSPYILNVSFKGVRAEVLLHMLEAEEIYVSTGSACTSKTSIVSGSYVMKALKLNKDEIEGAIRFSFSVNNTREEIDKAIEVLDKSLKFLRRK